MESSLHKQLKELYTTSGGKTEVAFGGFRVDALSDSGILEIQLGPLVAIRRKLSCLIAQYPVHVVKPLVVNRHFRWVQEDGTLLWHRADPRSGPPWGFFADLVYMTKLFPHPNLTFHLPRVVVEEERLSPRILSRSKGQGQRKNRGKKGKAKVLDIRLLEVRGEIVLREAEDVLHLLPRELPDPIDTAVLSRHLNIPEWEGRRIVYCLRECGVLRRIGYRKRYRTYTIVTPRIQRALIVAAMDDNTPLSEVGRASTFTATSFT
jgi:hypothetical protein